MLSLSGLKAATSSASTLASNDAASSDQAAATTGSLEGEGEGNAVAAPAIESSAANSQLPRSTSLDTTAEAQLPEVGLPLSPSQAIRQLLGSTPRLAASGDSTLSPAAVDEAMQSLLPALQLQLSDELSETLAGRG